LSLRVIKKELIYISVHLSNAGGTSAIREHLVQKKNSH